MSCDCVMAGDPETRPSAELGLVLSGDFIFHYHTITQSRPQPAIVTAAVTPHTLSHNSESNKSTQVITRVYKRL